jgi:hypothetical protein
MDLEIQIFAQKEKLLPNSADPINKYKAIITDNIDNRKNKSFNF